MSTIQLVQPVRIPGLSSTPVIQSQKALRNTSFLQFWNLSANASRSFARTSISRSSHKINRWLGRCWAFCWAPFVLQLHTLLRLFKVTTRTTILNQHLVVTSIKKPRVNFHPQDVVIQVSRPLFQMLDPMSHCLLIVPSRHIFGQLKNSHRKYHASNRNLAKILASDSIEKVCGDVFKARGHELVEMPGIKKDELIKIIGDYDGLVVRSGTKVTKEIIDAGVNLKIIGRAGTGVDNIDVVAATNKGILVVNTPGGNTISTGELALSHILALARNIPQACAALKEGRWERSKYTGTELAGKTLGVIGVGRIGREVAKWCRGFDMTTIGYDPVLSEQSARSYGIDPVSIEELLDKSDFITIHTPLTKETQNIINAKTLAQCKKGVRIINCARGGIVDEAALLDAINSGHVAGASLDCLEV